MKICNQDRFDIIGLARPGRIIARTSLAAGRLWRVTFFSFLLAGCEIQPPASETDLELERLTGRAEQVSITRDDFGVPHIYGKTDADAVFGLLYAQAEDDFNRIERNYIWAMGRLAEVEGEAALYSDVRARLFMSLEQAQQAYEQAPPWLQDLCDAFADGLNFYLATHPEVKPRLLTRFEPWMPMFFSEGSIGGDIEQIPLDGIAAFYGEDQNVSVESSAVANNGLLEEPKGSNGIAISGDLTESGHALFLINPHTSFYFRGEVHVVSEEGLNAYGAVTWGQFFVYQGFNEHTGWMHTSTRLDFMDEFIEDVADIDGQLVYRYGEELRPVQVSDVLLKYKAGDETLEKRFPLYHTHHGPVTHKLNDRWVATKINWDPINALRQSFIRTKLANHTEFREMMDIRTNSSNNTVFADADGNIAYYHGNFIPRRDEQFDYSQPVDGSDPRTDWQGIHEVEESLTILNPESGWLQNCNSTPFTAAGEFSPRPEDFPRYMAPDPENFRGIQAVRLLKAGKNWDMEKLLDLAYDPYLVGFEKLIPGLIFAFDQEGSTDPDLKAAIEILRNWDLKSGLDSTALTLAHFYGLHYGRRGQNPLALSRSALIDYFGTASPLDERLAMFSEVLVNLTADFGHWKIPWGEVNRLQRITGDINQPHDDAAASLPVGMASGRWGALASFGAKRYPGTKKIYGTSGNSFVAIVEFADKVKAKTLLAGGQSGDPLSPHFYDQAERYIQREFKTVAYYPDEVRARAVETYQPGLR
jgi:acyl-homoserine-lactone acylase